jgi:hypothetical protein
MTLVTVGDAQGLINIHPTAIKFPKAQQNWGERKLWLALRAKEKQTLARGKEPGSACRSPWGKGKLSCLLETTGLLYQKVGSSAPMKSSFEVKTVYPWIPCESAIPGTHPGCPHLGNIILEIEYL